MTVAIVTARAGSKRIPKKNLRLFNGRPIIEWPLETLKHCSVISQTIVSTDSEQIAEVAHACGAAVFLRSPENAGDYATSIEAVREVLSDLVRTKHLTGEDEAFLVYPTSVFLTCEMLLNALDILRLGATTFVNSVQPNPVDFERSLRIDAHGRTTMRQPENFKSRSQDSEASYHDAAQLYLATVDSWLGKDMYTCETKSIVMPKYSSVDIDDELDWTMAEVLQQMKSTR